MRVVAVIPARANSKRIPNKNLRLLNNHPMVYYAIKNALDSKYIDDVILTTDSEEIALVGNQMNIEVHMRDERLCGDDITLDPVIYDVVKRKECDYVISMQPTSPTLLVDTLDKAIKHCIEGGYDSVISAYNQPSLSWKHDGNSKKPAYVKRLNRQYLPSYYKETGAFIISKREVVTNENRLGEKVDLYELSEEEAIDVSTFQDIAIAKVVLQQKKVAIYVNGNNVRGTGHIYRTLELADEFYTKPDIYYDKNQTEKYIFGETTYKLIPVDGVYGLLENLKNKQYDIFINDILDTTIEYIKAIRKSIPNTKIVNFEDEGEGAYKADLVFNALFNKQSNVPQIKNGEKYYIAPKKFMIYNPIKINRKVKNIFISFGGADPQNYTDRLLKIINKEKYKNIRFHVVIGKAKRNVKELMEYNKYGNISVFYDIKNMPEIMSKCDVAIASRGRTGYELALLGIPSIAIAQNQNEEKHDFMSRENGFNYLGLDPSESIIEANIDLFLSLPPYERQKYQKLMINKDLKNGRRRIMSLIDSL